MVILYTAMNLHNVEKRTSKSLILLLLQFLLNHFKCFSAENDFLLAHKNKRILCAVIYKIKIIFKYAPPSSIDCLNDCHTTAQ
jgi:hypothetical protein